MNLSPMFFGALTGAILYAGSLHAGDLIDLRQGYGEAKWGMPMAELKAKMPKAEDISRELASESASVLHKKPGVLRLAGEGPVFDTLYIFERDRLVTIVRTFDQSVTALSSEALANALSEQFVRMPGQENNPAPTNGRRRLLVNPPPSSPSTSQSGPTTQPVAIEGPKTSPTGASAPAVTRQRVVGSGPAVPTTITQPWRRPPTLQAGLQQPPNPDHYDRPLSVAGEQEGITAILRLSSNYNSFTNVLHAKPTLGVPLIQLWIENHELEQQTQDELDQEVRDQWSKEAQKLAPQLAQP